MTMFEIERRELGVGLTVGFTAPAEPAADRFARILRWAGWPFPGEGAAAEWIEQVRRRLQAALAAAAAGEPIVWPSWPPADEQAVIDAAAAEFGFAPWTYRPHDPALDNVVTTAERTAAEEFLLAESLALAAQIQAGLDELPRVTATYDAIVEDVAPGAELRETLPEYLDRVYPHGGPPGMVAVRLVPVTVFGADQCDVCEAPQGYGLMDAAECWSDCNSARGHIYRRDEGWMHRLASECIIVWVDPAEAGKFDQVLGDQVDEDARQAEAEAAVAQRVSADPLLAEMVSMVGETYSALMAESVLGNHRDEEPGAAAAEETAPAAAAGALSGPAGFAESLMVHTADSLGLGALTKNGRRPREYSGLLMRGQMGPNTLPRALPGHPRPAKGCYQHENGTWIHHRDSMAHLVANILTVEYAYSPRLHLANVLNRPQEVEE
jgi:hypothetical protein